MGYRGGLRSPRSVSACPREEEGESICYLGRRGGARGRDLISVLQLTENFHIVYRKISKAVRPKVDLEIGDSSEPPWLLVCVGPVSTLGNNPQYQSWKPKALWPPSTASMALMTRPPHV